MATGNQKYSILLIQKIKFDYIIILKQNQIIGNLIFKKSYLLEELICNNRL